MRANQAQLRIATMARVPGASPGTSGLYAWHQRGRSARGRYDEALSAAESPLSRGRAGRGPGTCAPDSCSTPWRWPCSNAVRTRSSTTPTKAANPPPSPSASAAGDGAWSRRWARSGIASTTPWPRASSRPSNANCSTARTSRTLIKRAEESSSSSRDGITHIVVTKASVSNPRSPSRGATRTLHETQALNCPLKRDNSRRPPSTRHGVRVSAIGGSWCERRCRFWDCQASCRITGSSARFSWCRWPPTRRNSSVAITRDCNTMAGPRERSSNGSGIGGSCLEWLATSTTGPSILIATGSGDRRFPGRFMASVESSIDSSLGILRGQFSCIFAHRLHRHPAETNLRQVHVNPPVRRSSIPSARQSPLMPHSNSR